MRKYDVAAYVWPAYTKDEPRAKLFWSEGIGEWETVKKLPKKPLWGYVNESDPYIMEMQIEAATDYGVNVFIYDWYWYDNRPFLECCLNDGFLKARNNHKMKFYIMWANHDANYVWDIRNSMDQTTVIWNGAQDRTQFHIIANRWIENYFKHPSYYKIDNKPLISIYDIHNFVNGLGGIKNAKQELVWLNNKAKEAGFNGVHLQFVKWGDDNLNLSGVDGNKQCLSVEDVVDIGFESLTHYQFVHFTDIDRNYDEIIIDVQREWDKITKEWSIPYCPHVSIGWDNNPRFSSFRKGVTKNNTPQEFEKALMLAKRYVDKNHSFPLITINSWNEWTETSYLEPDDIFGYAYLEAVKRVFK